MTNLRPWDGREPVGVCEPYPAEDIVYWNMRIDREGTVWYKDKGNPGKDCIWCSAARLTRHMIRLGYRRTTD